MVEQIIIYSFLGTMLGGMLANMVKVITSSSRDLTDLKARKRRVRRQPPVSVLVYAQNDAPLIERCLKSIVKSSYRKYEIIVVDNGSKDDTKQIVKNFKDKHRKKTIRLLAKRRQSGKGSALNAAFAAHAKGQLIMVLDASSMLDSNAIRNAVQYFTKNDQLSAVAAQIRSLPHPSIIGLLQQFDYLSRSRAKRVNKTFIEDGAAVTYRREIFGKLKRFNQSSWKEDITINLSSELPKEATSLIYANNVLVYTEPIIRYGRLISQRYCWIFGRWQAVLNSSRKWALLPFMAFMCIAILVSPFILTYFIYLALAVHYSMLLAISWVAVTVYLFFFVWSDPYTPMSQRLRLSLFIPIMFSVYYITTFIQAAIQIRCLINLQQITKAKVKTPAKRPNKRPVLRSRTVS